MAIAISKKLPLSTQEQQSISPTELAKLIMELLLRNWDLPSAQRNWKISYYPCQHSSIRAFEIVGHSNAEHPAFAYKWNEAIALLKSRALIMFDPSQGDREDFMVPTTVAQNGDLDAAL